MKPLKIALLTAVFLAGLIYGVCRNAHAQTDYTCVNQCLSQGYLYGLCVKACSY